MDDYIKREAVKSQFDKDNVYCYDIIMGAIDLIPSADVRENVRGEWIHWSRSDECSVCGYDTGKYEAGSNFCPNCGADMRGE